MAARIPFDNMAEYDLSIATSAGNLRAVVGPSDAEYASCVWLFERTRPLQQVTYISVFLNMSEFIICLVL